MGMHPSAHLYTGETDTVHCVLNDIKRLTGICFPSLQHGFGRATLSGGRAQIEARFVLKFRYLHHLM